NIQVKNIEIICDFSLHCGVAAKDIDKYGTYVWVVSNFIESMGYQTKIIYTNDTNDIVYEKYDLDFRLTLKDFGTYITPNDLAKCLSSVFFRRATFGLMVRAADLSGNRIAHGYGTPKRHGKGLFQFEEGKLWITP